MKRLLGLSVFLLCFWLLWHLFSGKGWLICFLDEVNLLSDEKLIDSLNDRSEFTHMMVISRLVGKGSSVVPKLVKALQSNSSSDVREGAAIVIGRILNRDSNPKGPIDRQAISSLENALKDSNNMVRVQAAIALFLITGNGEAVLPTLLDVWKNGSKSEKYKAAEGLSLLGSQASSAVDDLSIDLNSPDELIRRWAADTLLAIKRK